MQKLQKTNRPRHDRTAAAVVELSVCLPILVVLLIATLDVCGMFHVQQTLKVSAYEGARIGIVPGAEAANVHFQCNSILDSQGINSYTVSLSQDPSTLEPGDFFTVSIDTEFDANAYGSALHTGRVLTKTATLKVE